MSHRNQEEWLTEIVRDTLSRLDGLEKDLAKMNEARPDPYTQNIHAFCKKNIASAEAFLKELEKTPAEE